MRGKWVLLGVSVVLVAIAAGALSRLRQSPVHDAAPTVKAAEAPAPAAEISLSGRIDPQHVVTAGAQVTGTIVEILVDAGQEVFEGELLARISNLGLESARENANQAVDLAQSRLERANAALISARLETTRARADATRARTELDRAQRNFERQQMLNREGATPRLVYERSQREFQEAQAQAQSLQDLASVAENRVVALVKEQEGARGILDERSNDLEDVKAQLQTAEVRSPVDGLLMERKGEVGKEVGPQEQAEMFKIAVDVGELLVTIDVDPEALKRVKVGDPALVVIAELGGEGLPGSIQQVEGGHATVAFTSPNPAVRPGMTAQVRIRLR